MSPTDRALARALIAIANDLERAMATIADLAAKVDAVVAAFVALRDQTHLTADDQAVLNTAVAKLEVLVNPSAA